MQKLLHLLLLLLLLIFCEANEQQIYLRRHLKSRTSSFSFSDSWAHLNADTHHSTVFVAPQDGLMQADKITRLPGQPDVDFDQYAGYVTVDPHAGRALFYYFVESPTNSSTNPLVLWLNGGPGCSSFGYGAMQELGPFRVNSDGKTLFRNNYAWNNVANVIFLESPAGVGFSYSNTTADYDNNGDGRTAADAYAFIVNWLERFPQYKRRDFYITGESYAGHYVPQLAQIIMLNTTTNQTAINLKGISIGNALVDDKHFDQGRVDFLWAHALISDKTYSDRNNFCDFANHIISEQCSDYVDVAYREIGGVLQENIYAPVCDNPVLKNGTDGSVDFFDPCSETYVRHYLNIPEVQSSLHVKPTSWDLCSIHKWTDWQSNVLPTIENLMAGGLRVWMYSGDVDSNVPITYTRYAINSLDLPVETAWRSWYHEEEVGGYVVVYRGRLTLVTVRGAGHDVPSYQPRRALGMISAFLQGILPAP